MQVRAIIEPATPPEGDNTITKSILRIATDANMNSIVATHTETDKSLIFTPTIQIELVPGVTYYADAEFYTALAGLEGRSKIIAFTANDDKETLIRMNPPEKVFTPNITLFGSDHVIDAPISSVLFKIDVHEKNKSNVDSMDIIIEDINGDVVFADKNVSNPLDKYMFDKTLQNNTFYTVRVSVKLDSGVTSLFGGMTLVTCDVTGDFMVRDYNQTTNGLTINLIKPANITNVEMEVYDIDYNLLESSTNADPDNDKVINIGRPNGVKYEIVRVRGHKNDGTVSGWYYIYKKTKDCSLPYDLPGVLACAY